MEIKKCPACGKTVLATAKECKHCGKSFEEKPEVIAPAPIIASPNLKKEKTAPTLPYNKTSHSKEKLPVKIIIVAVAVVVAIVALVVVLVNNSSEKGKAKEPNYTESNYENPVKKTTPNADDKSETIPIADHTKSENAEKQEVIVQTRYAYIKGKSVIFRQSYSTTSNKQGYLDDNEQVLVLDEYIPLNTDEAITNKPVKLYSSYGSQTYTLPTGKAVKIISNSNGQCEVSFIHPQYGKMQSTIYISDLESISGDKWYKIKRHTGETGWVYSKFVNI